AAAAPTAACARSMARPSASAPRLARTGMRQIVSSGARRRPERRSGCRQPDQETAAGGCAVGDDVAIDRAGEPARERESESCSLLACAWCPAADTGLEDPFALLRCDTGAVVFDSVDDVRVLVSDVDPDLGGAVAAGVFEHRLDDPFREVGVDADAQ